MKLVVGLGNPGKEYENTYHNLGFMAVDRLAKSVGAVFSKEKFNALYTEILVDDEKVLLIKPLTYMNLSGQALKQFANFYKVAPQDIVVFCDDIDLPKGTTRYREHGSGGTHNGLKNIVYCLSSKDFKRIKIGAGNDTTLDLKDYVLSKIDDVSWQKINPAIDCAINKLLEIL